MTGHLVYSPLIVYTAIVLGGELTLDQITIWVYVSIVLGLLLDLVVTAALVYGTFQQLRGRHASIGESIGVGLKRLFPVLGVGILAGLFILGGLLLLVIPGLIFMCMLWVAVPVAVVERPGVVASLKRSAELTGGYRWSVFGILFVLNGIERIVDKVLEKSFIDPPQDMGDIKVYLVLVLGIGILLGSLQAVASAVGYHDLRQSKEGVGIEELARVFE